jgi:hypothetical protein
MLSGAELFGQEIHMLLQAADGAMLRTCGSALGAREGRTFPGDWSTSHRVGPRSQRGSGRHAVLSVVTSDGSTESGSLIDEIVRDGARRMLAAALEAEVNQYIAELAAERDERGHRLVVRNGHHRPAPS